VISDFPQFSQIKIGHQEEIKRICSKIEPYSDFNFVSLFSWNTNGSAKVSILNRNLVIQFPDYTTDRTVISVFGHTAIDETLELLVSEFTSLELVPKALIDGISRPERFKLSEDRDNFDYVYKLSELANLDGGKFKKKRNKINSVNAAFSNSISVKTVESIESSDVRSIKKIFSSWSEKYEQEEQVLAEGKALNNLLHNVSSFNLLATILEINGEEVAFSINEVLGNGFAICHFEKALPVHSQINSFIAVQAARDLYGRGFEYVNWEQDLGIEGLRKSKLSFYPERMLKKYTVSRA
jgi:hypothetical protein